MPGRRELLLAVVLVAVLAGSAAAVTARLRHEPVPLTLGVATDDVAGYDSFRRLAGTPVGLYQWYQHWEGSPAFDRDRASAAASRGAIPMLTWEPWAPGGGTTQPRYAMARIAAGDHDAYIAAFARQVRDWGGTLALRFAHELNTPSYPWCVGVNGNRAEDALAAWRHVRSVFAAQGADVVWVWSVSVSGAETAPYAAFYPGDDEVDWVGLDGYNGGTALPWGGWRSPRRLLGPDLDRLDELTDRPVLLTEVGSAEAGGDKAAWIGELFGFARDRGVAGLVWFDHDKETDWRVRSSPASADAFRAAAGRGEVAARPPLPRAHGTG